MKMYFVKYIIMQTKFCQVMKENEELRFHVHYNAERLWSGKL